MPVRCEGQPPRQSAAADIPVLHDVTAVFEITAEAWAVWTSAKTGVQL